VQAGYGGDAGYGTTGAQGASYGAGHADATGYGAVPTGQTYGGSSEYGAASQAGYGGASGYDQSSYGAQAGYGSVMDAGAKTSGALTGYEGSGWVSLLEEQDTACAMQCLCYDKSSNCLNTRKRSSVREDIGHHAICMQSLHMWQE
jgi:hypothetical protein